VRTKLGRTVRRAFIVPAGHVLLGCDYSQVELRLLAHLSRDPGLLEAFARGEDIHTNISAAMHNVPPEEVTKIQRRHSKDIIFGLMYRMSSASLAVRANISEAEAQQFVDAFFQRFSGVQQYMQATVDQACARGYVETLMGRRRYFPELLTAEATNEYARHAAERSAVNMPIQGTAADIIKLAMIRLHACLATQQLKSRLVLQMHDELILEVPNEELEQVQHLVVDIMSNAYEISVPLTVNVTVGNNWMDMK